MDQPEFPHEASAKSKWCCEQWTSCAPTMGVAASIANHVFPLRITSNARSQELPTIRLRQRCGGVTTPNAPRAERGNAVLLTQSPVADGCATGG